MMGLPISKGDPLIPKCPYCDRELIALTDAVDPHSMVFHIVRISQHMIGCRERLRTGQPYTRTDEGEL